MFARCIFAAKQVYKSSIIIHVHDNVKIYVTIVFGAIVRNYLSRKHLTLFFLYQQLLFYDDFE